MSLRLFFSHPSHERRSGRSFPCKFIDATHTHTQKSEREKHTHTHEREKIEIDGVEHFAILRNSIVPFNNSKIATTTTTTQNKIEFEKKAPIEPQT